MTTRTVTGPRRGNGSIGGSAGLPARTGAASVPTAAAPAAPAVATPETEAPAPNGAVPAVVLRRHGLAREPAGFTQRIEELEVELEQRTRRLQQLIGERDELRSLLAGRDAELRRLNREIGALAARAAPAEASSPGRSAAVRNLLENLRHTWLENLRHTWKALPGAKPAAPRPNQANARAHDRGLVPWVKDRPPKDILAVVLFGLPEAEIERLLEVVERSCAVQDVAPLLLTDNDSFQLFRNRRVVFEFLPPRSEQARLAPDLDWQLFTLRRLALIRRKWQPVRVVAFGRTAAEVVQLWLDSPFEETPIPAALNGRLGRAELASGAGSQSAAFPR